MIIPVLVIAHNPLLNALLRHLQRDVNLPVLRALSGHNPQFDGVQCMSGISARKLSQEIQRFFLDHGIVRAHSPIPVIYRLAQQFFHCLRRNGLQLENNGSGNQRAVDLKIRILGGGTDQDQSPVLHKGQQIILLALVEPMNLVYKKKGALAVHTLKFPGFGHHFLHILFAGHSGVDLGEFGAGTVGNYPGQSGLARAGRPVKDHGTDLICLNRPVQQLILADDMLLPHHLIQRPGTHPGRQGRLLLHIGASHIFK